MIESIYSKEQTGLVKSEVNTVFRFPKNVRQIGQIEGNKNVYVEDYVMTYIRQLATKSTGEYEIAVLLGKFLRLEDSQNIFISGAVGAKEIYLEDSIAFSNEAWTNIYGDIKAYFSDVEIVGWFLTKPGLDFTINDKIRKIHLDNFAGQDKTLLMYDSSEQEEAFYIYGDGKLIKQKGYYVFYEKNEEMQNYMIEKKESKSEEEEFDDRAIKEIRNVIASKHQISSEKKFAHFTYGLGTLVAAGVLIVASTALNNYNKMDKMEQTLESISENLDMQDVEKVEVKPEKNKVTEVETMRGKVTTIKQEKIHDEVEREEARKAEEKKEATAKKTAEPKTPVKKVKKSVKKVVVEKTHYIVKEGDTLASISIKLYHTVHRVSDIQKANGIKDKDKIYEGQKLIVP